ncbi:hypothetical protein CSC35_0372 [Enterobacter hormaechei]|nr:hypothetical protein CSC35_0372 [Enterobacter hormaechei]UVY99055.1 hypothetical protein [Enterobacter hormaechei subsp. xiangfangensis]
MMSLWDALRMNMMISYQELVRTFPRKALDWLTPLEKFAQLVDYHMAFETVAPHV